MTNDTVVSEPVYTAWMDGISRYIDTCRLQSALKVNADMLQMYWHIGNEILNKQKELGWGGKVVDQLSHDLSHRFPDMKGLSVRNLKYMRAFAEAYPTFPYVQVTLAQSEGSEIVQVSLAQITWYHHITLLEKTKEPTERLFYIQQAAYNGWSRDMMLLQIQNHMYQRSGKAVNNFAQTLLAPQSDLATAVFRDPYNFDFLGTANLKYEADIEKQLTTRITDFLMEMGRGFSFVGRQYKVSVDHDDYYIDLLMYHLKLHCYVVVELKAGDFKPEYVSKLNFYISAVDDTVRSDSDNPTIGLLLCRSKGDTKARYSLRGVTQPLGIAAYETEKIFNDIQSSLPTIEEIEASLNKETETI